MTGDKGSTPDEKLLSLFRRSWISLTRKRSVRSLFWLGLALVFGGNLLELDRRVKFREHYGKLRDELLNSEIFYTLKEDKVLIE